MRYFNHSIVLLAATAALGTMPALAQAPQGDDWSQGKLGSAWTFAPIGDNQGAEAQAVKNGALTVTAGGADVWTAPDNFVFIYQKASGNFRFTVPVQAGSLAAPADSYAKAGVMIRSSDDPSAAYVYLFESPFRFGVGWEMRQDDSGTNQGQNPNTMVLPASLRLTRLNGVIYPSCSSDGVHFVSCGSPADANQDASITAPVFGLPGLKNDPVLIGIATTAHNTTQSATASYGPFTAAAVQPGTISGTATLDSGGPFASGEVDLVSADGTDAETVTTDANGKFSTFVVAGDWNVTAGGVATYSDTMKVMVAANGTATANLTVKTLPSLNLGTASKDTTVAAKAWADSGNAAAVNPAILDPANPTFNDKDFTTVNMPEDLATTDMLVANDSYFWYRVSFAIPASFQANKGSLLHLHGFNVDDGDFTFVNGHYVGSTINNWSAVRDYVVPSDYINWTGTNVIAILGQQGGGGAGNGTDTDIMTLTPAKPSESGVFGRVVTQTGGGIGGATITLTDSGGQKYTATTSSIDGSYAIARLPAGTYSLAVSGTLTSTPAPAAVTTTAGQSTVLPDITVNGTGFGPTDLAAVDVTKLTNNDIGATGDKGTLKVTGTQVQYTAGGGDIWNNDDDFNFASLPNKVSGDFTAVVQAQAGAGSSDWSKAGIMARVDTTPGSPNVTALNSFFYGPRLQWRATQEGASNSAGNNDYDGSWIMLTRTGDTFSMYRGNSDASNATLVAQQTLTGFPKDLLIGLDATSHAAGTEVTANFDGFKLSNTGWTPTSGGGTATKGDLNGDGKVDIKDATLSLQIAVGSLTPTVAQTTAGDVNGDAKLNIQDTTLILAAAVGIRTL